MQSHLLLDLAKAGHRMPIGTHLVLAGQADHEGILLDGKRLGKVTIAAARRFRTPLAVPLMDLTLEKAALLRAGGVPEQEIDSFHFTHTPTVPAPIPLTPRMEATCAAIAEVAREGDLVPIGMCIGPFSLMTKLVADPITPVFLAGTGVTAGEDQELALVESALAAAEAVIGRFVDAQIAAGAKAMIVCEPAANRVYFSPRQLEESYATFERLVIEPMRRLKGRLDAGKAALIFHDCGELTDGMVDRFARLGAAMLSFGNSRNLWEDAARVPDDIVIYGNLPTKRFYSAELSVAQVEELAQDLVRKMHATGHPFILGSECDVLSVPGAEQEIWGKVDAFMRCGCGGMSARRVT
ncbi:MAG TPA: uroporphyrinogen decarboxylase family protein [Opitutaceae bacterium]|nr:uroporphyrinogen decarboxylase family protein [Opitutaceae bacterium]